MVRLPADSERWDGASDETNEVRTILADVCDMQCELGRYHGCCAPRLLPQLLSLQGSAEGSAMKAVHSNAIIAEAA